MLLSPSYSIRPYMPIRRVRYFALSLQGGPLPPFKGTALPSLQWGLPCLPANIVSWFITVCSPLFLLLLLIAPFFSKLPRDTAEFSLLSDSLLCTQQRRRRQAFRDDVDTFARQFNYLSPEKKIVTQIGALLKIGNCGTRRTRWTWLGTTYMAGQKSGP